MVLYNTLSGDEKRYGPMHLFAKDFVVYAAADSPEPDSLRELVRGTLEPNTDAQTFRFDPIQARFVKLVILSSYNPKFDRVQLGEFEVYSTDGINVANAYNPDGSKTAASLLHSSSALGTETEQNWTAANIHDGVKSGPAGSWSSAGPPPLILESPDVVVDVTDRVDADGRLEWDIPAGKWIIMRFVCATRGCR